MDMDIAVALGIITAVAGKLLFALIAYFIGRAIVDAIVKAVGKLSAMEKVEPTARTFILSFVRIGLYIVLLVTIIGILGVPMASVVAVLASASVTVGLALQGALANLAGGLMLMFFKPFSVGDFVEAAGVAGVVKEVTMFYTTIMTTDNRRVTVPNGSLMTANVTNYSSQKLRRVDLTFACAKSEAPANIQSIMQGVMAKHDKVLKAPEADAPFARLSGGTNEAMEFTVRAWCKSEDYWDVYFDLTQQITEALGAAGVQAPAVRIVQ